jgi:hypothetical protein
MGLFGKKQLHEPEPEVIDLRSSSPAIVFGMPAPCPSCGGPGYLDSIDLNERVMYQHCPSCFDRWTIAEADILAAGLGDG